MERGKEILGIKNEGEREDVLEENSLSGVWIGARELSIAHGDNSEYWRWNYVHDTGVEVAELVRVCWLDIAGKIDTKRLTRKTSFGAYLVFKLTHDHSELERTIASVRFAKGKLEETAKKGCTVFISKTKKGENGTLRLLRSDGWMEIKLGEFFNNLGEDGEVEMRLMETNAQWKSGLIVRGIDIRPNSSKNSLLVSSAVLHEDIVSLLDFIKSLKNEDLKLKLTFMTSCLQLCYYIPDDFNAEMSCITHEVHDLVQSLFHLRGDDMLVKLMDHVFSCLLENIISSNISDHHFESSVIMTDDQWVELLDALLVNLHYLPKDRTELIFPSMTQYEHLRNVFGNLRDLHGLIVNGCIERKTIEYVLPKFQLMAERVGHFCFVLLPYQLDKDYILDVSQVNSKLANLLEEINLVELEVLHICSTVLKASKLAEVGRFINQVFRANQLGKSSKLAESLIHLQQHMVTYSTSAFNIHVMIEFLLIILADVPKDVIHQNKLSVFLERIGALTKEVFILVHNLEESSRNVENTNETSLNLLEKIKLLKEDLKSVFLKATVDTSRICFPMSDGPLFMALLLRNLNDLLNSNAYSVALIKEEIGWVKENLELIRSFFGNVEQKLHRDLWNHVLEVAYAAQHAINSIIVRDDALLQLIFLLPDTIEKLKLAKQEVQEKISKNTSIIFANSLGKPVENKSAISGKIIVGFEEETKWIIGKLTSGPAERDVISIVGMPGIGKSTLAYKVYNHKAIVGYFDVRAWCTVDQERNEKKLLQKIYNQVIGSKDRFSKNDIDDDVADKLRKQLFGKRYLIVLDDLWDTATWDKLTRAFSSDQFQKGSRVILTSRKKEVALHGECYSEPLDLRLRTSDESWELLEKRVFGEECYPDELKVVGEKIAQKCDGLPLALDLIGGVISRKEKEKAWWLEVLNNLSSFILEDEEEVMKVIQLSYDQLSDHLKPCFVYLASYPKDEDIKFSKLKDLWCCEGLVGPTDMKSVEEVMEDYVNELISSSLVIVRGDGGKSCKIHDLVHDFCLIKARKEKLFDLTTSIVLSSSSSSSDPILRGMTIHYKHLRSKETPFLFKPEKKNPSAKHLLSLKIYNIYVLPCDFHLSHLRLLNMLDLSYVDLTDSLLNEIGMLVHLRCLSIDTEAEAALPQSFANLRNLETLKISNWRSNFVLSPIIWSLAKLQHVYIYPYCSVFVSDSDKPIKLENLRTLEHLKLSSSVDSEPIFNRFPNLRTLEFYMDCSDDEILFPRLDVLNKVEQVKATFNCREQLTHVHQFDFYFPSCLKKLLLKRFNLTSDALSRIGRSSPNLQKLQLSYGSIDEGEEWNMEQGTFHNLKSLALFSVSFSEWQVTAADESFPVLEKLSIRYCRKLKEIPESFGDITTLKYIRVWESPQLEQSAFKIKKYVADLTGEDWLTLRFES